MLEAFQEYLNSNHFSENTIKEWMYIPYPDREDMTISVEQYKIGRILNFFRGDGLDGFDRYLNIAGIKDI